MTDSTTAGTRQQVLDLVVEKGPVTASVISRILGLTTAAVRRHITALERDEEIIEHEVPVVGPRGRGRPLRIKPHAPLLVRVPVNSFEFHACARTPQAECLMR